MPEAIVAGHLCLDVIPDLSMMAADGDGAKLQPGTLVNVGPALLSTGGAVSNSGIALHKLGVDTSLAGKVGDDLFGTAIVEIVKSNGASLADGVIVSEGEASSYTVVINPPGIDRTFLHCPGTNDTYGAEDFDRISLEGCRLVHFGYPPLMARIFEDGGEGLAAFHEKARAAGVTTSLDMARPDPDSDAGRVDWGAFLERVLPHVDIFLPSIDELLYMLDRPLFDELEAAGGVQEHVDGDVLGRVSARLIERGVAVAAIKLGDQGLYLRTSSDVERLEAMGACAPSDPGPWAGRELYSPCLQVEVAGTTGAGDCTIAGFLAGVLKGLSPEGAVTTAVAVGGSSVETADATGGVPAWDALQSRLDAGWARRGAAPGLAGWDRRGELFVGPNDSSR